MLIGITGGLASGKSLVTREFKALGAKIVDADIISREVSAKDGEAYADIVKEFGQTILKEDGSIDRKALGAIVFSNRDKLKKLNSITHPRIIKRLRAEVQRLKTESPDAVIVVDAALLMETGLNRDMDAVIVVDADEDKRIKRSVKRDQITEGEARQRMEAQMNLKEKAAMADFVIENNGTMEETERKARDVFEGLKGWG
ncbi:MAG: dephospho-CoA kinase [Deltaproteobacteria bacterium]|nr:dephospho-CoA kinase [Deltaproteobacteria bacterium]